MTDGCALRTTCSKYRVDQRQMSPWRIIPERIFTLLCSVTTWKVRQPWQTFGRSHIYRWLLNLRAVVKTLRLTLIRKLDLVKLKLARPHQKQHGQRGFLIAEDLDHKRRTHAPPPSPPPHTQPFFPSWGSCGWWSWSCHPRSSARCFSPTWACLRGLKFNPKVPLWAEEGVAPTGVISSFPLVVILVCDVFLVLHDADFSVFRTKDLGPGKALAEELLLLSV